MKGTFFLLSKSRLGSYRPHVLIEDYWMDGWMDREIDRQTDRQILAELNSNSKIPPEINV